MRSVEISIAKVKLMLNNIKVEQISREKNKLFLNVSLTVQMTSMLESVG